MPLFIDEALMQAARQAYAAAYAPYSSFRVGAAVRGLSGRIYSGCNVENAAYPQGTCAEAGAIAAMVCAGETRLRQVLVLVDADAPASPCGGCRQKLCEFGGSEVRVSLVTLDGQAIETTLGALLPGAFSSDALKQRHS